jgi:UDP:flavonoid glycosyltransferase YjiC (YdhE family)
MFKNEGIPLEYKPKKNYGFGYIFSNIPELVLNPIELEIIEKIAPEQVYLGYFTPDRPNNAEIDLFVKELTNCSKKLIYVSFGTLYSHKQKEIEKLLELLDNIGHEMKNFTIIVSLGNNLILKNKWIYKNLVGLNFVNQIDLLNYADIFITHGGINSIKESINSKCPMLVIPLEGDQVGNASKVVLLNLGFKLSYSELNKESLINCISKLLETDSKIKQHLNLIADRIKKTYFPEKIIQSLLDRTMYLK